MREFIRQVRDAKLITNSFSDVRPYPDDVLYPITANMIEFLTPAGRSGFGTEGLAKSDQPINGVVAIADPHREPRLLVLRIRLPARQDRLISWRNIGGSRPTAVGQVRSRVYDCRQASNRAAINCRGTQCDAQ
jgi:hypothetical protein